MTNTVSISAHIPEELGKILDQVSRDEERSKSYYVKKGLESFLKQRQQVLQLDKNIALSLQQVDNGEHHEANDVFWHDLKQEIAEEIAHKKTTL